MDTGGNPPGRDKGMSTGDKLATPSKLGQLTSLRDVTQWMHLLLRASLVVSRTVRRRAAQLVTLPRVVDSSFQLSPLTSIFTLVYFACLRMAGDTEHCTGGVSVCGLVCWVRPRFSRTRGCSSRPNKVALIQARARVSLHALTPLCPSLLF